MGRDELTTQCPCCGMQVKYDAEGGKQWFPFCSRRCRLIYLGKWFDEQHRISEPAEYRFPSQEGGPEESGA